MKRIAKADFRRIAWTMAGGFGGPRTTDSWAYRLGGRLDFSRPGKPMDNPFIESFNGRLRDEHPDTELFFSVADARHSYWSGNGPPRPVSALRRRTSHSWLPSP